MTMSKAARVAALMVGGSLLVATPALSQEGSYSQPRPQPATQPEARPNQPEAQPTQPQPERRYSLSRAEQAAINPLIQANAVAAAAGQGADWAPVRALLPAAQAAAQGNDAKYLVARVELSIAVGTNDIGAQERAIATLLASPSTLPNEAATYRGLQDNILNRRAETAFAANDFATAERIYRQLLQANPNDQRLRNNLRIIQERSGNTAGALQSLMQEIQAAEAGGGRASEDLYQRAWRIPAGANRRTEAWTGLQRLLRHYPSPANWRLAMDFARQSAGQDSDLLLDIYRFARVANLVQSNEYPGFVQNLYDAGLPGETKAVIDAAGGTVALPDFARIVRVTNDRINQDRSGLAGEIRDARSAATGRNARRVADALFGYGRYAEAVELYRLALTKGGEDPNLVNTRLGATLASAGQRAEAETALRAVTGPRAEVAALWLAWLARNQG